jgi:hypothetical protein
VLDLQSKQGYLLIQKCGTKSLLHLTKTEPSRFVLISSEEFLQTGIESLTVFVREPIKRYISGLCTQMQIFGINQNVVEDLLNVKNIIPMFDPHTMPQFWFLLRFGIDSTLKFKIVELSKLADLTDKKLNQGLHPRLTLSEQALSKIDYAMTDDIVLYNQFLGKTVTISELIDCISNEIDYCNENKKYKNIFPYLRDM